MRITLARTVRLDVKRDGVTLRWSTEALCAWLCRRNVHRLRDDFMMDRVACSCRQVQLPNEWEQRAAHQRYLFEAHHKAVLRMQERLRMALSTPDFHRLWKNPF